MIALLLAAAVTTQAAPAPRTAEPMPNAFRQPAWCGEVAEAEAARQNTAFHGRVPLMEYAVFRRIDGCMVRTPVGYHPSTGTSDNPGEALKPGDGPANRR